MRVDLEPSRWQWNASVVPGHLARVHSAEKESQVLFISLKLINAQWFFQLRKQHASFCWSLHLRCSGKVLEICNSTVYLLSFCSSHSFFFQFFLLYELSSRVCKRNSWKGLVKWMTCYVGYTHSSHLNSVLVGLFNPQQVLNELCPVYWLSFMFC